MDLLARVKRFIHDERLLDDNHAPVGVALSGGADSVALLAILTELGVKCVALHCNFQLRGDESDRDEAHARAVAARLGAEIEVVKFDVEAHRRGHRGSVEMACRELRYRWFGERAAALGLVAVAVGHHAEDNAETMIINLLRGSGVRGLKGIRPRNGMIIRPLLTIPKGALLDYLAARGLDYMTDSSNMTDDYLRNRIRHHLLPAFSAITPDALTSISRSLGILREQSEFLDAYRRQLEGRYVDEGGAVDVAAIISVEPLPKAALYEILAPRGFSRDQVDDIAGATTSGARLFVADERRYLLSGGILRRYDAEADEPIIFDPREGLPSLGLTAEVVDLTTLSTLRCSPCEMLLSLDAVDGGHWELRRWRHGDRIAPYGMSGTRLLSDLYSDAHLPLDAKSRQWVMTRDGVILWAVGLRTSRHFAVRPGASAAIRFTFHSADKPLRREEVADK